MQTELGSHTLAPKWFECIKCLEYEAGMFCCWPKTALLIYGACLALGTCMLDSLRYKGTQALRRRDLNSNPNPATALWFQDLFCSSFSDFPWHTDDTHKMPGSRNCSKKNAVTSLSPATLLQNTVWWLFKDLPRCQEGKWIQAFRYWEKRSEANFWRNNVIIFFTLNYSLCLGKAYSILHIPIQTLHLLSAT